ncbi:MAG: recombinase family protein [Gaiellaceae bacterium]|jgi:DNA invertase Pin-like site-specific DNA recombinase
MRTADGYVRVSRVGGRKGDSFISPDEQRAAIEAWAISTGTTILEWYEDLDESGGTLERPGFKSALERCRAGLTGGIVAAKLDRLTRSVAGLDSLLADARSHGFNLVAIDLALDLDRANGELVANVLASVAQWERKRRADDWAAAQRNAISRGVPNGRAPIGYRKRGKGKGLEPNADAPMVLDAFRRRAAGESFAQIGRQYGWSHTTVRSVTSNEVYLGIARCGEHRNEHAHLPIVTRELFEAANRARTKQPIPPGETTRDRLLIGLARCRGCGHTLKHVSRSRVDGSHVSAYYCKDAASVQCGERAYVHVDLLDDFVAAWFEKALESAPRMVDVLAAGRELERAQDKEREAERELYAFVEMASALDPVLFQRGVSSRQARVDAARENVRDLSSRVVAIPSGGSLIELWGRFDVAERRNVLASFLDRIEVSRGASSDLVHHVRIYWADGTLALGKVAYIEESLRVAAA